MSAKAGRRRRNEKIKIKGGNSDETQFSERKHTQQLRGYDDDDDIRGYKSTVQQAKVPWPSGASPPSLRHLDLWRESADTHTHNKIFKWEIFFYFFFAREREREKMDETFSIFLPRFTKKQRHGRILVGADDTICPTVYGWVAKGAVF